MKAEKLHETAVAVTSELHNNDAVQELYYQDPKFWVAVAFGLFVLLAAKFIWPAIARSLDNRAHAIKSQLEQAAHLQAEAELLLQQYEAQQKQSIRDAEEILENAKRDAGIIREQAARDLQTTLARRAAQAEEQIARAEQQALSQIRTQIIDAATESARSVVSAQLKGQKDDPAITRALAAIEAQIH
jgi:F-type H+-transporting ATPase subunit b